MPERVLRGAIHKLKIVNRLRKAKEAQDFREWLLDTMNDRKKVKKGESREKEGHGGRKERKGEDSQGQSARPPIRLSVASFSEIENVLIIFYEEA